jgi:hypothetical protein
MAAAFDRTHCTVGIRPVHRTEPIQASGFEAEIIDLDRRRSAYPHGAELRSLAKRARDERVREFAEEQARKDASLIGRVRHFFNRFLS